MLFFKRKQTAAEARVETIRLQVAAMVPVALREDLVEKVLAGQLSLVDIRLGIHSMQERFTTQVLARMTEQDLDRLEVRTDRIDQIVAKEVEDLLGIHLREFWLEQRGHRVR